MQPDIRPISVLTKNIVMQHGWWIFFNTDPEHNSYSYVHHSENIDFSMEQEGFLLADDVVAYGLVDSTIVCYPVDRDSRTGMITAAPWPILPGEEEIEEWRGIHPRGLPVIVYQDDAPLHWRAQGVVAQNIEDKDGFHPSPRQNNRWVWEADR